MCIERIEKTSDELDFSKVDFASGNWSWGRGGRPLRDDEYSISHIDENLVETRYKLPACINDMLAQQAKFAAEEVRNKIKAALNGAI